MSRKTINMIVGFAAFVGLITLGLGLAGLSPNIRNFQTRDVQQQETNAPPTLTESVAMSPQQDYVAKLSKRLADLNIQIVNIEILAEKPFEIAVKIQSSGPSSGLDRGSFDDVFSQRIVYREALLIAKESKIQLDSLKTSYVGNDGKPLVVISDGKEYEDFSISNFHEETYRQLAIDISPSKVEDVEVVSEITKLIDSAVGYDRTRYIVKHEVLVTQKGVTTVGQYVDVRYQVANYTAVNWGLSDEIEQSIDKLNSERGASIQLFRLRIESQDGVPISQYVKDYLLGNELAIRAWTGTEDIEWPSFSSPPAGAKLPFRKSAYPPKS